MRSPEHEGRLRGAILRLHAASRVERRRVDPLRLRRQVQQRLESEHPDIAATDIAEVMETIWMRLTQQHASELKAPVTASTAQDIRRAERQSQVRALKGRR